MTYPAYPLDKLPYPVRDSFSQQYGAGFKPVQMDDAHNRIRRRYAMQPVNYTLTWHFTFEQFEWFEGFLRYDCAQASGYFTLPLNAASTPLTLRFVAYPDSAFDENLGWVVTATVEQIRNAPSGAALVGLPTFPTTLPIPEKVNYSIKRADTVSRSSITEGLASERARFKDEVAVVQMQWTLSSTEYTIFDNFVHDTLLGGLAPFVGPFANGSGQQNVRLNMIDVPKVVSNMSGFDVTCIFEVRDIPTISELKYRGWDKNTFTESYTFGEQVTFKVIPGAKQDSITFTEQISFRITKLIQDTFTYSESVSFQSNQNRSTSENLSYTETLSFYHTRAPYTDTLGYTAGGFITVDDYADDWVEFGYVGTDTTFTN